MDMTECTPSETLSLMRSGELPINYDKIRALYREKEIATAMFRKLARWGCMPEGHSFLIGIDLSHPKIEVSEFVRSEYSTEIWLVFQYEFQIIEATTTSMTVKLYFSGQGEVFTIPYDSIFRFVDENAEFDLSF
ncbi:MAG: ClpXP protease specificity-enhancing factor SspB [Pseudomonadota bacterium]